MNMHIPVPPKRIVALGGPVSQAIAVMRAEERAILRDRFLARVEADLAVIDAIDGLDLPEYDSDLDADFIIQGHDAEGRLVFRGVSSDFEDNADAEPSLGSLGGIAATGGCSQLAWAGGGTDEREAVDEDGGDIQDEPHDEDGEKEPSLCGLTAGEEPSPHDLEGEHDGREPSEDYEPDVDGEPSLCGITANAEFATGAAMSAYDSEPSLASLGGTAEGCEGAQIAWSGGNNLDHEEGIPSATHDGMWLHREPGEALALTRQELRRRRDAKARARYGLGELRVVALPGSFRA